MRGLPLLTIARKLGCLLRRRIARAAGDDIRYWIDFTCEFDRNPGVQRVTRSLAHGFEELGEHVTYLSWSDADHGPRPCTRRQLRNFSRWNGPRCSVFQKTPPARMRTNAPEKAGWLLVPELTYWRIRGGHQEAWESDPVLMLSDYARAQHLKIAFLFYDLIPLRVPGYPQLRALHERYVRQLAKADLILPISRDAGLDLARYFSETLGLEAKVLPRIIPQPLAQEFLGCSRKTVYDAPAQGPTTIMCVSHIEPRKNQVKLLEAFNAFCEEHPKVDVRLSLVGVTDLQLHNEVTAIARANPRVDLAGNVSDSDMIDRYHRTHFTVFPSVAEGFGLPIVESLWLARPCICANFGAMAEVATDGGCLTIDTRSTSALKNALERMIFDRALRESLAADAIRRPMSTWREYADRLLTILRGDMGDARAISLNS